MNGREQGVLLLRRGRFGNDFEGEWAQCLPRWVEESYRDVLRALGLA